MGDRTGQVNEAYVCFWRRNICCGRRAEMGALWMRQGKITSHHPLWHRGSMERFCLWMRLSYVNVSGPFPIRVSIGQPTGSPDWFKLFGLPRSRIASESRSRVCQRLSSAQSRYVTLSYVRDTVFFQARRMKWGSISSPHIVVWPENEGFISCGRGHIRRRR